MWNRSQVTESLAQRRFPVFVSYTRVDLRSYVAVNIPSTNAELLGRVDSHREQHNLTVYFVPFRPINGSSF